MSEPLTESELRQRAVGLLARRDHARRELETKLEYERTQVKRLEVRSSLVSGIIICWR